MIIGSAYNRGMSLLPITPRTFNPTIVEEDFRRIQTFLAGGGLPALAGLLGGSLFRGDVLAGFGAGFDTKCQHGLTRVPSRVVLAIDVEGLGGLVYGDPLGHNEASAGNETPWDSSFLYVRSSRDAEYQFLVI